MNPPEFDSYTRAIQYLVLQCQMLERREVLLRRFLAIEGNMDFLAYVEDLAADVRKELENKISM